MEDLQRDHRDNLIDLLEARDVEGLTKEIRDYKIRRQDEIDSFQQDKADRVEEYNTRLTDERDAYSERRAEREQQYLEEQSELAANLAEQIDQRRQSYEEQMVDLQSSFEEQRATRTANYEESRAESIAQFEEQRVERQAQVQQDLADLDAQEKEALQTLSDNLYEQIVGIETLLQDQYDTLLANLDTFINSYTGKWRTLPQSVGDVAAPVAETSANSGSGWVDPHTWWSSGVSGRASGGYANKGLYTLGENGREFVLNATATKAMERQYGYLTQGKVAGGSSGQQISFNPTFVGMGNQDRTWFLNQVNAWWEDAQAQLITQIVPVGRRS
jgi:small-conductance mechanosensitive channel